MKSKYIAFLLLFLVSLGLDQSTKIWARQTLKPANYPNAISAPKTVIKGYWDFRYSENPGSAFGMFRNQAGARYFLFGIGIVCLGVIGLWLYRLPPNAKWLGVKLGLLAGGAIGNMVDRAMYSRVTDFILWKITTSFTTYEWPTFNVADAALVIGVGMILIDRPRDPLPPEESQPASGETAPAGPTAEKPASA
ncbi:MAG TPA: signal peptidase II [Pseudomonadota bacterium]|nr:signal peptidase II [Pseudomonadota bacterium]